MDANRKYKTPGSETKNFTVHSNDVAGVVTFMPAPDP